MTRAMELAPNNPSFLDMRNAILMADKAIYASADRKRIWTTFALRGMGYYAGSLGGNDGAPLVTGTCRRRRCAGRSSRGTSPTRNRDSRLLACQ